MALKDASWATASADSVVVKRPPNWRLGPIENTPLPWSPCPREPPRLPRRFRLPLEAPELSGAAEAAGPVGAVVDATAASADSTWVAFLPPCAEASGRLRPPLPLRRPPREPPREPDADP